jgi:hypothetical protein
MNERVEEATLAGLVRANERNEFSVKLRAGAKKPSVGD